MWISEVVFQGVLGSSRPSKIRIEQELCRLSLPEGVDPAIFLQIILSLLYPTRFSESDLISWADSDDDIRLGVVMEFEGRTYKLFRQVSATSVTLQDVSEGGREKLAQGAQRVAAMMTTLISLPDWDDFRLLNTWDFKTAQLHLKGGAESQALVQLYRDALAIEDIELKIENTRAELSGIEAKMSGRGAESKEEVFVREELKKLKEVEGITHEERLVVEKNREREASFKEKLDNLEESLGEDRGEMGSLSPVALNRDWPVIGTVVIAMLLFLASVITGMRQLALFNVFILGGTTWLLLRRFSKMAVSDKLEKKLLLNEERKTRLEAAREEHRRRYRLLLSKASAGDERDFTMNVEAFEELTEKLEGIKANKLQSKPTQEDEDMKKMRESLLMRLEDVTAERSELGEYSVPSYELEKSLEEKGLDPRDFKRETFETELKVMPDLFRIAQQRDLVSQGKLTRAFQATWSKLLVHLAGSAWASASLDEGGNFIPPARLQDDFGPWSESRPDVVRALVVSFCVAIFVSTPSSNPYSKCRQVCLVEPFEGMGVEREERFMKMLQRLSERTNVMVLTSEQI